MIIVWSIIADLIISSLLSHEEDVLNTDLLTASWKQHYIWRYLRVAIYLSKTTWTNIHHSMVVFCYDFAIATCPRSIIYNPIPSVKFNQLICRSEMITDLTFDRNNGFVCHAVRASLLILQQSYFYSVNKLKWSAVAVAAAPAPNKPNTWASTLTMTRLRGRASRQFSEPLVQTPPPDSALRLRCIRLTKYPRLCVPGEEASVWINRR